MNIKILSHLLLIFLVISCNKKKSQSATPSLVITGSGSSNTYNSLYQSILSEKVTVGSPTFFSLKLYAIYISKSDECTNPVKVADFGAAGKAFNMLSSPTLFASDVGLGTYECIIFKMSDRISYKVDDAAIAGGSGSAGGCKDKETLHTHDIHHDANENWLGLANDSSPGNANADQAIYIFASTSVDPDVDDSPRPDIHTSQSLPLSGPLVVPGAAVFFADFNNGVANGIGGGEERVPYCGLEAGGFGFR